MLDFPSAIAPGKTKIQRRTHAIVALAGYRGSRGEKAKAMKWLSHENHEVNFYEQH
jgi:cephalosporin-C deacetylase-like acetyl esterase